MIPCIDARAQGERDRTRAKRSGMRSPIGECNYRVLMLACACAIRARARFATMKRCCNSYRPSVIPASVSVLCLKRRSPFPRPGSKRIRPGRALKCWHLVSMAL